MCNYQQSLWSVQVHLFGVWAVKSLMITARFVRSDVLIRVLSAEAQNAGFQALTDFSLKGVSPVAEVEVASEIDHEGGILSYIGATVRRFSLLWHSAQSLFLLHVLTATDLCEHQRLKALRNPPSAWLLQSGTFAVLWTDLPGMWPLVICFLFMCFSLIPLLWSP